MPIGGGTALALAGLGPQPAFVVFGNPQPQRRRGRRRAPSFLDESTPALGQKGMQMGGQARWKLSPQRFQHLSPGQAPAIDHTVGRFESGNLIVRVTGPSQADRVEADDAAGLAVDQHERGDVLHHSGVTADHGKAADPAELVNGDSARYECPILDGDVSAEQGVVGENAAVADARVVAQMATSHQIVVAADQRLAVWLEGSVDGNALTKDVVVADYQGADVGRLSDMLGSTTDHNVFADLIVAADPRPRLNDCPARHRAVVTEPNAAFDRRESRHGHTNAEFGFRAHRGQRMNAHRVPATRKCAMA